MTVASFNTQNQSDTYNERARREFKPPTYLTMLTVAPDSTVFHVFSLLAMCTTVSFFVFLMYVCRVLIKITYLLTYLLYRVRQKHFCGDDNTTLRLFSASSDIPRHSLLSSKLRWTGNKKKCETIRSRETIRTRYDVKWFEMAQHWCALKRDLLVAIETNLWGDVATVSRTHIVRIVTVRTTRRQPAVCVCIVHNNATINHST